MMYLDRVFAWTTAVLLTALGILSALSGSGVV